MLTSSTSQGRRLPRVFRVFRRRSSASSVSGVGGMSGGSSTAYFATCITFFVDKNHVARLAAKPLPVGRTAAFLFGSSLSRHCLIVSHFGKSALTTRVRCPFTQHSHVPTGRSHPSDSGICSHMVPPILLGIHSHTLWSVTLGSAGLRTFVSVRQHSHCTPLH